MSERGYQMSIKFIGSVWLQSCFVVSLLFCSSAVSSSTVNNQLGLAWDINSLRGVLGKKVFSGYQLIMDKSLPAGTSINIAIVNDDDRFATISKLAALHVPSSGKKEDKPHILKTKTPLSLTYEEESTTMKYLNKSRFVVYSQCPGGAYIGWGSSLYMSWFKFTCRYKTNWTDKGWAYYWALGVYAANRPKPNNWQKTIYLRSNDAVWYSPDKKFKITVEPITDESCPFIARFRLKYVD
jgi:hypothetical protein